MAPQPCGVHLVGSINLPTTSEVFDQIPTFLPNRLRRIPDGETGHRHDFVRWQMLQVFSAAPEILIDFNYARDIVPSPKPMTPEQISATLEKIPIFNTKYDDYAIESYALFKQKKEEGHIPAHARFQVSLPGLANVIAAVAQPSLQLALEPRYEEALARSLQHILDSIPHPELAIQIDAAIEFAFMEGAGPWSSYFDPTFPGVIDRLSRFANRVAEDVELGFHFCYGDLGHRHFVEPKDMGLLVEVANALNIAVKRPIQWIHMPVPKARNDLAYFAPMKNLDWEVPELYLGLVHAKDKEGTDQRIAKAQEVVQKFGVATECGMGRTPPEEFQTIMEILKAVSAPVV